MNTFKWVEIAQIPIEAGIYAWYYEPELTEYDIKEAIRVISEHKDKGNRTKATEYVNEFLDTYLFRRFIEDPYKIILRGSLKPKYEGEAFHSASISKSLIERIVNSPVRLKTIKNIIEKSAPMFASPLYIGMSKDLNSRLGQHKALITRYKEEGMVRETLDYSETTPSKSDRDKSFAYQVCRRNIPTSNLFVIIQSIHPEDKQYIDIENILNRIHYPLFGRN